jgi:hypothetical protein
MSRFRLGRRAVLRGAGSVAIALPWLEIMDPARSARAAPATAKRFVAVYNPGGTVLDQWRPTGTETSFTLSPILAPFEPVKDRIIVLDGVDMKSAVGEQNQAGMIAWLTGTEQVYEGGRLGFARGPSLDQVLVETLQDGRRIASLNQAVRWGTGKSHGLLSPINVVNFANDGAFTPLEPRLDPLEIWQDLFGTNPNASLDWEKSMLDAVAGRYAKLSQRLGTEDRARLDQHLTRIRELEASLAGVAGGCRALPLVDTTGYDPAEGLNSADDGSIQDPDTNAMIPAVGRFMTDMLVTALACDLTAVGTLEWSDSEAKHPFPWLNLNETYAYYQNDGGFHPAECAQIGNWYMQQHAYLVEQMAGIDMGGHSLLDESVIFFGSHLQDPATHLKNDMPFVLAGNGGGLRTGGWVAFDSVSHNDLLSALANLFGMNVSEFGDPLYCDEPLGNLT